MQRFRLFWRRQTLPMELYTLEELSRTCESTMARATRVIFMAAATVESARGEKNPARKP